VPPNNNSTNKQQFQIAFSHLYKGSIIFGDYYQSEGHLFFIGFKDINIQFSPQSILSNYEE